MLNKKFIYHYSTCLGLGNSPILPGTIGSALSFVLLPFIIYFQSLTFWLSLTLLLFCLGVYTCSRYEEIYNKSDPKEVIIDEFVAQLLLLIFIVCIFNYKNIFFLCLISFFMFRFFDILKPWPIKFLEKKIGAGLGIMFDDIVAALFTFVILFYLVNSNFI
jgi:phosphatidylglycerophosphatase A